jgi:hypothetical protein
MSDLADDEQEFLDAFESGTLPEGAFHHRDHVRLAWLYLRRLPPAAALAKFSDGLRRFAASIGKSGLYHETITWAYLLLIRERMEREDPRQSWAEFAQRNPDLLTWKPSILDAYYRRETLESDLAREVFLLPDRLVESGPLSGPPPRAAPEAAPPSR